MSQYTPLGWRSTVSHEREARERFLPDSSDSDSGLFVKDTYPSPGEKPFLQRHCKAMIFHVTLLILNVLLAVGILLGSRKSCRFGVHGPDLVPTPMEEAISYETKILDQAVVGSANRDRDEEAFGSPSPETDAVWDGMIKYQNIRVSKDELGDDYRDNPGLVEFSDGSGYYGTVSVFHSIHCIKWVNRFLHFDHYYSNRSEQDAKSLRKHGDHCLSYLLQAVKCNADLTVFPMQWGVEARIPFGIDQGHHQCVNWQRVVDWMEARSVDIYQPGLVMHPTLGWAYSESVENVTGVGVGTLISGAVEQPAE